jgi:hypothetical protein
MRCIRPWLWIGAWKDTRDDDPLKEKAFRVVHSRHRAASPHPALWASLGEFFREPVPYDRILEAFPTADA